MAFFRLSLGIVEFIVDFQKTIPFKIVILNISKKISYFKYDAQMPNIKRYCLVTQVDKLGYQF